MSTTTIARLSQRPSGWKAAAPAPPAFALNIPKLPVPDLHDTLTRLKQSLIPIAWSDTEYAATEKKIEEFARTKGPELQQKLLKLASEEPHWLEEWWDDAAYLGYRDSVVVNVSYYYGFDAHPSHLPQTSAARAAALARAAMIFRKNLKSGILRPDMAKEGPLCMDTYRWMFDCCRIPGLQGLDWSVSYAKQGDTEYPGHIIIFRKNRVWKVEAVHNGQILSTAEIEKQIQHIYDNTSGEYPGVGVLTASNRDTWAKDYANLSSSPHNASILRAIQSAAFTISLDTSTPTTPVHHSRALWHGDVLNDLPVGLRNRWVDKPVQFIVFDNAMAGLMGEHSIMDGTPTTRLCDDVLEMLHNSKFDHGAPPTAPIPTPIPLDWEITPEITNAMTEADNAAVKLINSQELGFLRTSYGKADIKKFGISPDSWAQMIIQLAYRRLTGTEKKTGGTYESATTRRFYKGRTEVIRSATKESNAWVNSMDNNEVGKDEKKGLFLAAAKTHVALAKTCSAGQGIDRHLLGLKKLLEGEQLPAIFTDPLYTRSCHWVLSTSAIFSKHFPVYGWGEVVPDGFGVAYMTGYDDYLQFTITSRQEMPNAKFCEEIARAANDIYELHVDTTQSRL